MKSVKKDDSHNLSYATNLGFYVGDRVCLPDGRHADIDEIILRNVNEMHMLTGVLSNATVIRLDDELWLDS